MVSNTTTDSVWPGWVLTNTTSTSSSSYTEVTQTWTGWVSDVTGSSSEPGVVWVAWTKNSDGTTTVHGRTSRVAQMVKVDREETKPETEEEKTLRIEREAQSAKDREEQNKRRREQEAIRKAEEEVREKKRKEAEKRAKELLVAHLDDEQREELENHYRFHLVGADGQRYRLHFSTHGNVRRLNEEGKEVESLCIQPPGVPTGDAVLAQKLMLETDVQGFRRIANSRRIG